MVRKIKRKRKRVKGCVRGNEERRIMEYRTSTNTSIGIMTIIIIKTGK